MEIQKITEQVEQVIQIYAKHHSIIMDDDWYLLKLQEEMGELTQQYLMMTGRARKKGMKKIEIRNNFEEEIADVFCMLLLFANNAKVDLLKAIHRKWLYRLD